ncbi:MAG: hypothetical protein OXH51_01030 [Gemmatimonadetes bacterium]|nr:hypothetical protein [Gemmatimonadota bacterium]MCY3610092.1 hypothetical protein [Gemmatimonadota bacterium]MCY3676065.1 hypothetical protein [Gemmatimonadota bacterium]
MQHLHYPQGSQRIARAQPMRGRFERTGPHGTKAATRDRPGAKHDEAVARNLVVNDPQNLETGERAAVHPSFCARLKRVSPPMPMIRESLTLKQQSSREIRSVTAAFVVRTHGAGLDRDTRVRRSTPADRDQERQEA